MREQDAGRTRIARSQVPKICWRVRGSGHATGVTAGEEKSAIGGEDQGGNTCIVSREDERHFRRRHVPQTHAMVFAAGSQPAVVRTECRYTYRTLFCLQYGRITRWIDSIQPPDDHGAIIAPGHQAPAVRADNACRDGSLMSSQHKAWFVKLVQGQIPHARVVVRASSDQPATVRA